MAARLNELRGFLSVCGIDNTGPTNVRQTTELITSQRFTSINDFNGFKQADVGRLVKAFNSGNPVTGCFLGHGPEETQSYAYSGGMEQRCRREGKDQIRHHV
eukprot:scaffold158705_cov50-Cyclotella_meneghiniana.AAC.1